jgi:hypothetical protein
MYRVKALHVMFSEADLEQISGSSEDEVTDYLWVLPEHGRH